MLGDFKEGKVTSVWGSALQTADAVRGLNEGKEEVRERGPLENLGSNCIHGVRRTRIKRGAVLGMRSQGSRHRTVEEKAGTQVITEAKGQELGFGGWRKGLCGFHWTVSGQVTTEPILAEGCGQDPNWRGLRKDKNKGPEQGGPAAWVSSRKVKGYQFNSQARHMPGL